MATLGKFELIEELNSGSMGTVYAAHDSVLDRRVAVKIILPGSNMDAELKERFYREARACARLHHPSIVTIYDFGEEQGTAYIAMELLAGTDVRRIIQERRPLPLDVKLDLGAMVAEGLAHAHEGGIVHRDIKPSNLFVTEDGRAKILDFGIARTAASSLTMVGRVLGTPNYMAPEQILGKPCDARSDLFSAAIVLYELIAYVHPFQGPSIPKRIVRETADPLQARFPGAPPQVEAILSKALAKEPGERYQSGSAFAKDLRQAAEDIRAASRSASKPVAKELFAPSRTSTNNAPAALEGEGTEILMSRVLTALQDFDASMENQDATGARRAFEAVKKAAHGDDRFDGAVQASQERLFDLERSLPAQPAPTPAAPATPPSPAHSLDPTEWSSPAPVAPPSHPAAPPLDETVGFSTTPSAPPAANFPPPSARSIPDPSPTMMFKAELASQLAHPESTRATDEPTVGFTEQPRRREPPPPPVRPPEAPSRPSAGGDATSLFGGGAPPSTQPVTPPAPPRPVPQARPVAPTPASMPPPPAPRPPDAKRKTIPPPPPVPPGSGAASSKALIIGVGAVVVLLILAAGGYFFFSHRQADVTVVPFTATAQVTADQSAIVSNPGSTAATIVTLRRGDTLHVLRVPRSALQTWTEVQYMTGGRAYPKGFAKTADLGDWSSPRPEAALNLLRAFAPAAGATEPEIRGAVDKLTSFSNQFSGTPQAVEANLDMARWNVELARIAAATGRPTAEFVQAARVNLDKAATRADLSAQIQSVKQDVDALSEAKPAQKPESPAASAPRVNTTALLNLADQAGNQGRYADAERLVREVLRLDKNNSRAKDLLDKIQKARALEGQ